MLDFKSRPSLVKTEEWSLMIIIFQIFELVRFPFEVKYWKIDVIYSKFLVIRNVRN